jgi:hypothetical protein
MASPLRQGEGRDVLNAPATSKSLGLRRAWALWAVVTGGVALYVFLGSIAAYNHVIPLELTPGRFIDARVFRLAEDTLRLSMNFRVSSTAQRPELGESSSERQKGHLHFKKPGASVKVLASVDNAKPIFYEALPASAYGATGITRPLTSNLSLAPGVWRWPPPDDRPDPVLKPGFTTIRITVDSVEEPLRGESVELIIDAPLGFKSVMPNVSWLWWSFFWPLMALIQLAWLFGLLIVYVVKRY